MNKTTTNHSVPKPIFLIILIVFMAMSYYAHFLDTPAPEKAVNNFYSAYFNQDYDTVAQNLSVFWAVQLLPQYYAMSPAELLENRDAIEKDMAAVIRSIEEGATYPENLNIKIDSTLTREMPHSALVGYTFEENGQAMGMEIAILIKEKNAFRIYNMSPGQPEFLETVTAEDMQILDDNFKLLLEQK